VALAALACATVTAPAAQAAAPLSIDKSFGASFIRVGESTSLTFNIANTGAAGGPAVSGIGFDDTLPPGLVVATPSGLNDGCGGTATAVAGAGSVSLSGASLPADFACQITVTVKGTTIGDKNNTVQVTSNSGPGNTANAQITVYALAPTIRKSFTTASLGLTKSAALVLKISNPNTSTTLTGVGVSDQLPSGLVVATPKVQSGTCNGGTVTAAPATRVVELAGGMLAPGANCVVTVKLTGIGIGDQINQTCRVISTEGIFGTTATASVRVRGRTSPGQLYAFGDNAYGELGYFVTSPCQPPHPTPVLLHLPRGSGRAVQATSGGQHVLMLTSRGQLYGLGSNSTGALGVPAGSGTSNPSSRPLRVSLPGERGRITDVSTANDHTLALTSAGQVYSFGYNTYGQLGRPVTSGPNPSPRVVKFPAGAGPVRHVAAGAGYSLALTAAGRVYAFGDNSEGQLGVAANQGTSLPNPTPMLVKLPATATEIAAGFDQSFAVTKAGALYAFGANDLGQLGVGMNSGTFTPNPKPMPVTLPGAKGAIRQITAGSIQSFAVTSTGQLYGFGDNSEGQLGQPATAGTFGPHPTPRQLTLPGATGPVVRAGTGGRYGLALTSTGQLYAFGSNAQGQLGIAAQLGTGRPFPRPTRVDLPFGTTVDTLGTGPDGEDTLVVVSDLVVATRSLPPARVGSQYRRKLQAGGGLPPYRWTARGLPAGLSISRRSGQITGVPKRRGNYRPTVTVTDSDGIVARRQLRIRVGRAKP
jgi:hypothetical protein